MKKRTSYKPTADKIFSPVVIIEQMRAHGATFRFSDGGQLYVSGLGKLPLALAEMFLNHDTPSLLVAAVRDLKIDAKS